MRILVDTNVLFSALVFPRSKPARALLYIADNHEIILCDRNISELRDILGRKAPKYLPDAEVLLLDGADHTFCVFSNDDTVLKTLVQDTIDWFKKTL